MSEHRVLYVVESRIVLRAMLPAMLETRRLGVSVDAYVFDFGPEHSYYHLLEDAAGYLKSLEFQVFREVPQNMHYDIVYSAYPGEYDKINSLNQVEYYVRFSYGHGVFNITSVHKLSFIYYDFILCFGEPDVSLLSTHTKTYALGNIKLCDYKRTHVTSSGKKTLLYLPTWGEGSRVSSIKMGVIKKLLGLRDKYNIVTKMHNATLHFENQQHQRELFDGFDKIYDVNTPIGDMLNEADVVLSDISSAAFDALAGDVPLALFGIKDSTLYVREPLLHAQLANEEIVPHTENPDELGIIIEKALTSEYFAKQQEAKKSIFPFEGHECIDTFINFQNMLFDDGLADPWYISTRRALRWNYLKYLKELYNNGMNDMKLALEKQREETLILVRQEYEASTSWKITAPFRSVSSFIKKLLH